MAFERCQAAIEIDYSLNGSEHLMEKLPNNNPWAEKLEQVSLPDAGEAWKTMAAVLEKEMPADQKKRKRRLLLLIFLLFLLSGSGYFVWRAWNPAAPASVINRSTPLPQASSSGVSQAPARGTSQVESPHGAAGKEGGAGNQNTGVGNLNTMVNQDSAANKHLAAKDVRIGPPHARNGVVAAVPRAVPRQPREPLRSNPGSIVPLGIAGLYLIQGGPLHSNDPLKCPPVERQKKTGFVVGIGLNQAIPVDGQQIWTNPSGGLNTWWKDYIPVPFVRYYFQPKVFVQAEARIHAPQYTPKDLSFSYQYNDTFYSGRVDIKKLFYFQLPVTIHYAPSPDWSVGLGLQYSHYGSGIAAIADSNYYNYIGPLSGFPMVFVQHHEFRGLISLDYTYRHWIIGMSYDEAFTKALNVRVPNPAAAPQAAVIQAPPPVRNSSLQLFVRYILWDGRIKN
jgi:hypothetical protein